MFDLIPGLSGGWLYAVIFLGKMIEVALDTLRIMFISKGKKAYGTVCGFFSILIWIMLVSSVLTDVSADPMKVVVYCVAYACGIYMGTALEQRLAVGLTAIQIVLPETEAGEVGGGLRDAGFGVTLMEGRSVDGTKRGLVFVQLRRKLVPEAIALANGLCPDAVISVSDVRQVRGGFFK